MKNYKLEKIIEVFRKKLKEEGAPVMNLGSGQIAGTVEAGDDPPVSKKKNKKYATGGTGSRKVWLNYIRGK
tara:strand:+ start:237 stop:449 length:213 start_codon:yes stop_codon:yes gene_type:complete